MAAAAPPLLCVRPQQRLGVRQRVVTPKKPPNSPPMRFNNSPTLLSLATTLALMIQEGLPQPLVEWERSHHQRTTGLLLSWRQVIGEASSARSFRGPSWSPS